MLKLVHPGKYVEIHRHPVTAAEVMKKNPRHCVTRPDVFKFPWIVVRPESTLNLGRVYFIVPNRTIYHLLKTRGFSFSEPHSWGNQSLKSFVHNLQQQQRGTSAINSYAGRTPKHEENSLLYLQEQEYRVRGREKSQVKSFWPKMLLRYNCSNGKYDDDSSVTISSFSARDYSYTIVSPSSKSFELEHGYDNDKKYEHNIQNIKLKSCLRKEDTVRRLFHQRVSFTLPIKQENRRRRVTEHEREIRRPLIC